MKIIIILCEANDYDKLLLAHAIPIAQAFDCKVYLIHVASPDPDFIGYDVGPQHERDWRAGVLHGDHQYLQNQAQQLRADGVNATALLLQGETVATVLAEADRLNADMLVMGKHHYGFIHRMMAGSIGDEVNHRANCPVLIIPVES